MSRFAYINGRYERESEAALSINDRSMQFGDSVYEVVYWAGNSLIDWDRHMERLEHSLNTLDIPSPCYRTNMEQKVRYVLDLNRLREAMIYIQVTRGSGVRQHGYKDVSLTPPSLIILTKRLPKPSMVPITILTVPDNRWGRVDIKTTNLLPNVLAFQHAKDNGYGDAWFVDSKGYITESTRANAWIVRNGTFQTYPAGAHHILEGITRRRLIQLAEAMNIPVIEAPFTVDEAVKANEAFSTSSTALITPVIGMNGIAIGNGHVGPLTQKLYQAYMTFICTHTHQETP